MSQTADHTTEPPGRSWRNIRQEVTPLAMSRHGRNRRRLEWLKYGSLTVLGVSLVWGIYEVAHSWSTDRAALASSVNSEQVREVVLITDGVLTQKWVSGIFALPNDARLMSLELAVLRDKLLDQGQVRVAVLSRNFPDTLVVTLQERTPVARVQASDATGRSKQLFVAKDGTVYDGFNYDKKMVATLPWLDGIRLVKTKQGFEPIAGMDDVSALLTMAQLQAPHLYREWLIVSLARLETRDELIVKAQDIPEIVFSRKRDYFKQIAQLDYVVDAARALPEPQLQSVNLAMDGQVPVRMQSTPDDMLKQVPDNFSIQPSQRKAKRDL